VCRAFLLDGHGRWADIRVGPACRGLGRPRAEDRRGVERTHGTASTTQPRAPDAADHKALSAVRQHGGISHECSGGLAVVSEGGAKDGGAVASVPPPKSPF
jgi:hypothetical protein